ncbi:type IV pilin-like G/H family protein [Leptothermofonsia sp. ETS-13]|uniref:type IV pilin-like G/H family protein n=1 Tax=Leptothermofonsia sp. ETS-13 TaxID=3035696 RepID=UPI003BA30ECE
MKSEFKAKFIQHLAQKKKPEEGFTLIELLVVIIIIGILAAIALPSFLNQANKAKESESKQYVGSMNRTQQAYFLEKNTFASSISLLGLGINTDSVNYTYAIDNPNNTSAKNLSYPKNTNTLRAHTGGVQVALTAQNEATTLAILCQSSKPTNGNPNGVTFGAANASNGPSCTNDFEPLLN